MASLWGFAGLTPKQLAKRIAEEVAADELFSRAAELAYYFLFSLFPLLLSLSAFFGQIVGESAPLRRELFAYLQRVIPNQETLSLVRDTLLEIIDKRDGTLHLGLLAWLLIAAQGMVAVGRTLDVIWGIKEDRRPFWKIQLLAIGLTLVFMVLTTGGLVLLPYGDTLATLVGERMGRAGVLHEAWSVLRWPVVLAAVLAAFDLVYNFVPSGLRRRRLYWFSPGAVVAVSLWLAASYGFRVYLSYFNLYSFTYGSLGALMILMLWFYLTGFALLFGGVINSEIQQAIAEQQAPI